jgi:RNA-directed DNA polymerase
MGVGFSFNSVDILKVPKQAANLPLIIDDCSLTFRLGFRTKTFWYLMNTIKKQYTVHKIPKKKGGIRIIHAPGDLIKLFLLRLNIVLLNPLQREQGKHVTGYRKGISTVDAVRQHVPSCPICDNAKNPKKHDCPRRGTFIRLDIKDFFPTTRRAWIREFFISKGYSHYVSDLLGSILTIRDFPNPRFDVNDPSYGPEILTGAPQGSPASPAICNLVADYRLDNLLLDYVEELDSRYSLSGECKWVYTRYVDDLSFTCGVDLPLAEKERVADEVTRIVQSTGYRINKKKTHIGSNHYPKMLLGIVFNDKPNIPKPQYRKTRAIIHNCLVNGIDQQHERANKKSAEQFISWMNGNLSYLANVRPDRIARMREQFSTAVKEWENGQQ